MLLVPPASSGGALLTSFMVTDSLRLLSNSLLTVLEVVLWLLDNLVMSAWMPLTTPSISTWWH